MSRETAATKRKGAAAVEGEALETKTAPEEAVDTTEPKSDTSTPKEEKPKEKKPNIGDLMKAMTEGFEKLDGRFGGIDKRLDDFDERIKKLEGKKAPERASETTEPAPEATTEPAATTPKALPAGEVDKDGFVSGKVIAVAYRYLDCEKGEYVTLTDVFAAKQASGDRYIPVYVWKTSKGKICDDLTPAEIAKYFGKLELEKK